MKPVQTSFLRRSAIPGGNLSRQRQVTAFPALHEEAGRIRCSPVVREIMVRD